MNADARHHINTSNIAPYHQQSCYLTRDPTRSKEAIMSQTSSAPSDTNRRRRPRRSARNSLNGLLRQHAGTSLFVRPICWTDLHSKILGAHFVELPPCDTPLPESTPGSPPSKGHLRPSRAIMTLSDALTEILLPDALHPVLSSNAVKTVLSTLWPAAFSQSQLLPELHIFFGDRVYRDAVRTQVQWNYPGDSARSSQGSFRSTSTRPADSHDTPPTTSTPTPHDPSRLPMMCYIGKNQLASMRKNLFRIASGPGRTWNGPVSRLQQMRSKALVPANSDHDAHFVAIFLAMAQRHFYGAPVPSRRDSQWSPSRGKAQRPAFDNVSLRILTHDNETAEFIVYTGHVTASFLDRFYKPSKAPFGQEEEAAGMKIEYSRVPIWPILGLRERLGKALGEEIVGQFDPSEMKTWETEEVGDENEHTKRKRDALSEVFNASFEEETESEEQHSPPLGVKRRRLPEGTQVGVVV